MSFSISTACISFVLTYIEQRILIVISFSRVLLIHLWLGLAWLHLTRKHRLSVVCCSGFEFGLSGNAALIPSILAGKCAIIPVMVQGWASTVLLWAINHDNLGWFVTVGFSSLSAHRRLRIYLIRLMNAWDINNTWVSWLLSMIVLFVLRTTGTIHELIGRYCWIACINSLVMIL